ncbi:hypothetical protein SAMN05421831_10717 [Allopseudospirillum japonicum]|uniref:Prepilin peptidase dependent protein B n=1 Tax=Allopseudospirillum japonicum TaxID=64971 RepID=A0A1H6STD5_9GAMM|nr:hypothetical protein [Allopseudospirillum japonicum]SEI66842.1 hypothetical protein SAMN05421831_10717 [Allopseudospirillum japonicum]
MLIVKNSYYKISGMSLLEFILATSLGLVVILSGTRLYIEHLKNYTYMMRAKDLQNNIQNMLALITKDVRRAGYHHLNLNQDDVDFLENPFNTPENQLLLDDCIDNQCHCVTYTYDANQDGQYQTDEAFGFRWEYPDIVMRKDDETCQSNNWKGEALNLLHIHIENFSVTYINQAKKPSQKARSINLSQAHQETPCQLQDACVWIRDIKFYIQAQDTKYPELKVTFESIVRVRNDIYQAPSL